MSEALKIEIQLTSEELAIITSVVDCELNKWEKFLGNPLFDKEYYNKAKIANVKIKKMIKGE